MISPMVIRTDFIPKRTVLVVLSLLYFAQFPKFIASTLSIQSKICGSDLFIYSSDSSEDFFFVNGKFVNNDTFCKALNFYISSGCFILKDDVYRFCGLVSSSDELSLKADKRILDRLDSKQNKRRDLQSNESNQNKNAQKSLLTSKTLVIAAPAGFLIICCIFLCPCLHARRKQPEQSVHSNKMQSVDSSSSLNIVSVHEKIPGTSLRGKVPASPLRDKIPASPLRAKFPASPLHDKIPASRAKFPASPVHDKFPASPRRDKILGSPMRVPPSPSRFSMSQQLHRFGSIHLNFGQIAKATQNFSTLVQLGEGGFGTVYKAQLPDGHIVAIKRAKKEYFESLKYEFSSEVELLAKIEHRNLVKLLGYLDKGNERFIISEYVPNGSLREHLDGAKGSYLDFSQRLEISIDIAHALTYLHLYSEKQIIHRDVKASNILLTESMRAKVADFGFARLGTTGTDKTHIVTKVKGTVGYLDPEYMKTYQLTSKSDVYSFGVLLIEILTGRRPVELKKTADERVSLRWAFKLFTEGNLNILVDPMMQEVPDHDILSKMFELAFICAAPTRVDRPDMKYVGEQLWAIRMDYQQSVRRG